MMLACSKVGCCMDDIRKFALPTAVAFEVNAKVGSAEQSWSTCIGFIMWSSEFGCCSHKLLMSYKELFF